MKHNIVGRIVALTVTAMAAGLVSCASGDSFNPVKPVPTDKAVVYVFRPSKGLVGSGFNRYISIDDRLVGKLANNGYCYAMVPERRVTISSHHRANTFIKTMVPLAAIGDAIDKKTGLADKPLATLTFDATPGREYFFRHDVFDFKTPLTRLPKDQALSQMAGCKLQNE